MKQRASKLIFTAVTVSFFAIGPLTYAEANTANTSGGDAPKTTTTTTTTTASGSDDAAMHSRLEKEKSDLKIKLSTTETEKIKGKCKTSQGVVKTEGDHVGSKAPGRTKAYDEMVTKLTALVEKLKAKNVDVTELQGEIATLQTKVALFKTDLAAYQMTLADLKGVDCTTDPTAFKAALETARPALNKVIADATDIKTYVSGTIKPTLQKIRAALEVTEKSTSTTEGSSNTSVKGN